VQKSEPKSAELAENRHFLFLGDCAVMAKEKRREVRRFWDAWFDAKIVYRISNWLSRNKLRGSTKKAPGNCPGAFSTTGIVKFG
jgi:hypothetical protein